MGKNAEIVKNFMEDVFNAHDVSKLDQYMRDDYKQHNPTAPDGKEGFIEFTKFFFTLKPKMQIYKIWENENNEVAVFFKCTCEANGTINKVVDIYRLDEDGKLAEHWDVVEHDVGNIVTASGNDLFE